MATCPTIRLPRQWSQHVKSGVLHAISLASVVLSYARGRATGRNRLRAKLEQATAEVALFREELNIKDGRWERSRSRRRPHSTSIQRMRILQLRATRGWTLEKTARVFLIDLQTLLIWMRRLDEHGERTLVQTVEPVNRYPDFVRNLVRQLKLLFPSMGTERMANVLGRAGLVLAATTIRRMVRENSAQAQGFLDRAIRAAGSTPKYVITDKGKQFWCRGFKRWCRRRGIRPRYGAIGQPASIALVERFIRSLKRECTRSLLVPLSLAAMRREIRLYAIWYNTERPHMALAGKTPGEVYDRRAVKRRRIEPHPHWPHRALRRGKGGDEVRLAVSYVEARKHLPVIELRRAA